MYLDNNKNHDILCLSVDNNSFFTQSAAFTEAMGSPTACFVKQKSHSESTQRLYALLAVDYSTNRKPFCKSQSWLAKCLGVCVRTVQRGLQWLQRLDLIAMLTHRTKKIEPGVYRTASSIVFLKCMEDMNFSAKESSVAFHVALNERDLYIFNKSKKMMGEGNAHEAKIAFISEYVQDKRLNHGEKFQKYLGRLYTQLFRHIFSVDSLLAYCDEAYKNLVKCLGRWDVVTINSDNYVSDETRTSRKSREWRRGVKYKDTANLQMQSMVKEYVEPPKGEKASFMPDWLKEQIVKLRGI